MLPDMWTVGGSDVDVAALHLEQVVPLVHDAYDTVDAVGGAGVIIVLILFYVAV